MSENKQRRKKPPGVRRKRRAQVTAIATVKPKSNIIAKGKTVLLQQQPTFMKSPIMIPSSTMYFDFRQRLEIEHYKLQGVQGARLIGLTPFAYVAQNGTASLPFNSINAPGTFLNGIGLDPLNIFIIGTQGETLADSFNKFMIRKLIFRYQPLCGTGASSILTFAYFPDGAYVGDISTPTGVLALPSSVITIAWAPSVCDITPFLSRETWYTTDIDANTDAGLRQSFQGYLIGAWFSMQTNGNYGMVWLDYELDLLQPYVKSNLALDKSHEVFIPSESPLNGRKYYSKHLPREMKISEKKVDLSSIPFDQRGLSGPLIQGAKATFSEVVRGAGSECFSSSSVIEPPSPPVGGDFVSLSSSSRERCVPEKASLERSSSISGLRSVIVMNEPLVIGRGKTQK
jgi:hypothetical protein